MIMIFYDYKYIEIVIIIIRKQGIDSCLKTGVHAHLSEIFFESDGGELDYYVCHRTHQHNPEGLLVFSMYPVYFFLVILVLVISVVLNYLDPHPLHTSCHYTAMSHPDYPTSNVWSILVSPVVCGVFQHRQDSKCKVLLMQYIRMQEAAWPLSKYQ